MKKLLFLILFLFFSFTSIAQSYTKKYNSINSRYEYFDSRGTMVGYEKYNSVYGRWDYYIVNNDNNPYNRKPIEVAPVQSNVNLDLIDRALKAKQDRYDKNAIYLEERFSDIIKYLDVYSYYPKDCRSYFSNDFSKINSKINSLMQSASNSDLSNNSNLQYYINEINSVAKNIKNLIDNMNYFEKNPKHYTNSPQHQTTKIVKMNEPDSNGLIPILSEPKLDKNKCIGYFSKTLTKVIKKYNTDFYEVIFNDKVTGYVHKDLIDN